MKGFVIYFQSKRNDCEFIFRTIIQEKMFTLIYSTKQIERTKTSFSKFIDSLVESYVFRRMTLLSTRHFVDKFLSTSISSTGHFVDRIF